MILRFSITNKNNIKNFHYKKSFKSKQLKIINYNIKYK